LPTGKHDAADGEKRNAHKARGIQQRCLNALLGFASVFSGALSMICVCFYRCRCSSRTGNHGFPEVQITKDRHHGKSVREYFAKVPLEKSKPGSPGMARTIFNGAGDAGVGAR
jgi:hypothetical protein